jgi:hypothetical protein
VLYLDDIVFRHRCNLTFYLYVICIDIPSVFCGWVKSITVIGYAEMCSTSCERDGPFVDQFWSQLSNSVFTGNLWFLVSGGLYFSFNICSQCVSLCSAIVTVFRYLQNISYVTLLPHKCNTELIITNNYLQLAEMWVLCSPVSISPIELLAIYWGLVANWLLDRGSELYTEMDPDIRSALIRCAKSINWICDTIVNHGHKQWNYNQ